MTGLTKRHMERRLPEIGASSYDLNQEIVYNFRAMTLIETINQPDARQRPMIRSSSPSGVSVMQLSSLFRSLLAAYACGASGTYEKPQREV
jgi:hypothetical protein